MKFAIVNGERREAETGLAGLCPGCNRPMVARCGDLKVHHWAHLGKRLCDPWWENETEWHRSWKNWFPKDWQERVHHADDGEKHIADVKTREDWVLEFQNSPISEDERDSRNKFYGKIAWIINGARLKRDHPQFIRALDMGHKVSTSPAISAAWFLESSLLQKWGNSEVPIFIDFAEETKIWCVLPLEDDMYSYVVPFDRSYFVDLHLEGATKCGHSFTEAIGQLCKVVDTIKPHRLKPSVPVQQIQRFVDPLDLISRYRRRF